MWCSGNRPAAFNSRNANNEGIPIEWDLLFELGIRQNKIQPTHRQVKMQCLIYRQSIKKIQISLTLSDPGLSILVSGPVENPQSALSLLV